MSAPLTTFESRLLEAVATHIGSVGQAPTIAEIALQLGVKSRGSVHRYLQSLIAKEYLEKEGRGWRNLRLGPAAGERLQYSGISKVGTVADVPRVVNEYRSPDYHGISEDVFGKKAGKKAGKKHEYKIDNQLRIPLLGKIAAGMPIEAISNEEHLDLAGFFIGPDRFALRVTGDSMIEAGILDGDTVIIRKQTTAKTGDIIVALIDLQEATLKRLGQYSVESIELIPENHQMAKMIYSAARVSIQGVVVGQMRSY